MAEVKTHITDIAGLEAALGADAVEALAIATLDASWSVNPDRVVEYDGWDFWRESESPMSPADIAEWLGENVSWTAMFPNLESWRRPGGSTAEALEAMLVNWVWERVTSEGWFIGFESEVMAELCREFLRRVDLALPDGISFEPDSYELEEWLIAGHDVCFDPNVEGWLDTEVCVDVFLSEGDEWNTEFSNIRWLGEAIWREDSFTESTLEHLLSNNGLCWLAEMRGLPRDAPIMAANPSDPGHDLYDELSNNGIGYSQLTLLARCTLREWLELVAARLDGRDLVVTGAVAGLYDRQSGGGATGFEVDVPRGLRVPQEVIHDIAIDPGLHSTAPRRRWPYLNHDALVTLLPNGYGQDYTIHDTCGCTDSLWPRCGIEPAIGVELAMEERMSLETTELAP